MARVKTAISLEGPLLARIDEVAGELAIPRSRLIARAAAEFVNRYETERLIDDLDRAHAAGPSDEERALLAAHLRRHRRRLAGEW